MKALILSLLTASLMGCGQTAKAQQPVDASSLTAPSSHSTSDSVAVILGQWSGSFEGASSGKLELTLRQDSSSHQIRGQIVVILTDGNRYATKLNKAVFTDNQLVASYTDPEDGSNVTLVGHLDGPVLKGNWAVSDGQATGTWQAIRFAKYDERKAVKIDPNETDKLLGTYALSSDSSRTMIITKEGNQLVTDLSGTKLELIFISGTDFYFRDVAPTATGKFVVNAQGVPKLIVSQNGLFEWLKTK